MLFSNWKSDAHQLFGITQFHVHLSTQWSVIWKKMLDNLENFLEVGFRPLGVWKCSPPLFIVSGLEHNLLCFRLFFSKKYQMTHTAANQVDGIIYLISAFVSPICGHLVDRFGRNIFWCFCSIVLTAVCHGIMAFTFWNPYIAMVSLLGFIKM